MTDEAIAWSFSTATITTTTTTRTERGGEGWWRSRTRISRHYQPLQFEFIEVIVIICIIIENIIAITQGSRRNDMIWK
jgi:hypothetical protein